MLRWGPVTAYVLLILAVSSVPRLAPPASWTGADKIAHVAEYGILGALLRRAAGSTGRGLLGAVAVAGIVGGLDEIYQATVPGRCSSAVDWAADLVGGALGAAAYGMIVRRFRPSPVGGGGGRRRDSQS